MESTPRPVLSPVSQNRPATPVLPAPVIDSDADYDGFQAQVQNKLGIRLKDYKPDQMRRRLKAMVEQAGCPSFAAYFAKLERDAQTKADFIDRMTINVTELLRNPERFDDLQRRVLPSLLARQKERGGPLSIWSAGCSYGAEAYTLAMLLQENVASVPRRIVGTDIDPLILARANAPRFGAPDMANITPQRRAAFFSEEKDGMFRPNPVLQNGVAFRRHDLLADAYPTAEYDLILCRNVLIYFTDPAKDRIYRGFFQALKPGGVLFVGGTERLADHAGVGFELIIPFFYRKPG